jgi:hypothetical protein
MFYIGIHIIFGTVMGTWMPELLLFPVFHATSYRADHNLTLWDLDAEGVLCLFVVVSVIVIVQNNGFHYNIFISV